MSRDPIQETGGINLYQYCLDDPDDYFDATGAPPTPVSMPTDGTSPTPAGPAGDAIPGKVVSAVTKVATVDTSMAGKPPWWSRAASAVKNAIPGWASNAAKAAGKGNQAIEAAKAGIGLTYCSACIIAEKNYHDCINKWLLDPTAAYPCKDADDKRRTACGMTAAAVEAL